MKRIKLFGLLLFLFFTALALTTQAQVQRQKALSAPPGQITRPLANIYFVTASPANGAIYTNLAATPTVTVQGYSSTASGSVFLQEYSNQTGAWVTVSQTSFFTAVSSPAGSPAYSWQQTIPVNSSVSPANSAGTPYWAPGGVLRIRAISTAASPTTAVHSYTFDLDEATCFPSNYTSANNWDWAGAASSCASVFPNYDPAAGSQQWAAVTLVSSEKTPGKTLSTPGFSDYLQLPAGSMPSGTSTTAHSNPDTDYSLAYYQTINAPANLTLFKQQYGFSTTSTPAPGEVVASYYNAGDLGIGRDMHCIPIPWSGISTNKVNANAVGPVNGGNPGLACYVTNYGTEVVLDVGYFGKFGDNPPGDLLAANQKDPTHEIATVAIVQNPSNNRMDFITYNAARGNVLDAAVLDNAYNTNHNTVVPNNCLSCHGGSVATYGKNMPTQPRYVTTGASFLPFDQDERILTFQSPSTDPNSLVNLAPALRTLNNLVYKAPTTSQGVKNHITAMYPNYGSYPNVTYQNGFVPAGWSTDPVSSKLYQKVIQPYCAACHSTNANLRMDNIGQLTAASVSTVVCSTHTMPNAEQTASRFWTGSARAYLLNALGIRDNCNP